MTEERFTAPSAFCPNPEYWHSPDSEATESEVTDFIGSLVGMIQPEFVLETGTYHGHTAGAIGAALWNNGHGELVSIEKDKLAYEEACRSWASTYPCVTLLNMNTMDYIPPRNIDFGFFDSWQEGRHEEFLRYHGLGFIKPEAIVAFHDSAPHHQVYRLVNQHLIEPGYISPIQFHTPRGLLLGQVLK